MKGEIPRDAVQALRLAKGIVINGLPLVGIRPCAGPADIRDLDIYDQDCAVADDAPRTSCMIGESLSHSRWGN